MQHTANVTVVLVLVTCMLTCCNGPSCRPSPHGHPATAPEAAPTLRAELVTDCRRYVAGARIRLHYGLEHHGNAPLTIVASALEVYRLPSTLVLQDNGLIVGRCLAEHGSTSTSSGMDLKERLAALPVGSYEAVWIVNGTASNLAPFEIADTLLDARPLEIEPLRYRGQGQAGDAFIMYLRNLTAKPLNMMHAWGVSALDVDGVLYRLGGYLWMGRDTLGPGEGWSNIVHVGYYRSPTGSCIEPGRHRVAFLMAGHRSNLLTLEVPPSICTFSRCQSDGTDEGHPREPVGKWAMAGTLAITLLFVLLLLLVLRRQVARLRKAGVGLAWGWFWGAGIAAAILGAEVNRIEVPISAHMRVNGMPTPMVVFHLEGSQWVDFVAPWPWLNFAANVCIFALGGTVASAAASGRGKKAQNQAPRPTAGESGSG